MEKTRVKLKIGEGYVEGNVVSEGDGLIYVEVDNGTKWKTTWSYVTILDGTIRCQYDMPWQGLCMGKVVEGTNYCKEHSVKCLQCYQKQATHGCSCAGSSTCTTPLCDSKECIEKHSKIHYS